MVQTNIREQDLRSIVATTIMEADSDGDGRISFDEFKAVRMSHAMVRAAVMSSFMPPRFCVVDQGACQHGHGGQDEHSLLAASISGWVSSYP